MITINLLPDEFRVVEKKIPKIPAVKYTILGVLIFLLITFLLYIDFLFVSLKFKGLEKKWKEIQPEFQFLTQLQKEVDGGLKQEKTFLEKFVTTQRPLTLLLTWASEFLPETAWLTEVNLERVEESGNFMIKGLALPSKEKSSIEQIEDYLHQLKLKMPDANLSLTTTRQKMDTAELTLFTAHFSWGVKEEPDPKDRGRGRRPPAKK